ncbi:hypothetical protein HGP17_09520 [Rhizobium sp. P38BS-XIX]|uniref:hypothetical protein n=1 Tax=Rhizobium sp. P38BS-XIX TaxID=2726740 RepID=UPI0014578EFC|nr:hypothetical protein [Rhizobium sp. P38BS-XIX]NLR97074.1 hypothetical protein [Rhizobium sp. P38BS-XIX]
MDFRPSAFIPSPQTSYQIKTGKVDPKPNRIKDIENLLITPSKIIRRWVGGRKLDKVPYRREDLLDSVRCCLDAGGTFAVLLFGVDGLKRDAEASETAIRIFLHSLAVDPYQDAKIKVWKQSQICTLLQSYPDIALMIREQAGFPLSWFGRWDQSEQSLFPLPLQELDERIAAQLELRDTLRHGSYPSRPIRIYGTPGVGKSRWLRDALRVDDLSPHVVFASKPSDITPAALSTLKATKVQRLILVVDHCSLDDCLALQQSLITLPISLITIALSVDDRGKISNTIGFTIDGLNRPYSEKLLAKSELTLDPNDIKRWARLCDGNLQAFEVLAHVLTHHSANPLAAFVRHSGLDQLLIGTSSGDSVESSRAVLATLALLNSPGIPKSDANNDILFQQLDGKVGRGDVRAIVDEMKWRGVLAHGDGYSFSPFALKVKLWIDWWETFSHEDRWTPFFDQLLSSTDYEMGEMFEFAFLSPQARRFAGRYLKTKEGNGEWLRAANAAELFNGLARACPRLAMRHLDVLFENGTPRFGDGNFGVVAALRYMARFDDLFAPAIKKLIALALDESDWQLFGARQAFIALFSATLPFSEPAARRHVELLAKYVRDADPRQAEIALAAFAAALTPSMFEPQPDDTFDGEPAFDAPPNESAASKEAIYLHYWRRLAQMLSDLTGATRADVIAILLAKFPKLSVFPTLRGPIAETLEEIAGLDDCPGKDFADAIDRFQTLGTIGLPEIFRKRASDLSSSNPTASLEARLKACCAVRLTLQFDTVEGNRIPFSNDRIDEVARELMESAGAFDALLDWLLSSRNLRGFEIGFWLAKHDLQFQHWSTLIDAWTELDGTGGNEFVAGYLHLVRIRDPDLWEEAAIRLLAHPHRNSPALLRESQMTEEVAATLLDCLADGRAHPTDFIALTKQTNLRGLSDETLDKWLSALLDHQEGGNEKAAFTFAATCAILKRTLSFDTLLAAALLPFDGLGRFPHGDASFVTQWTTLSAWVIEHSPAHRAVLIERLLEHLGDARLGRLTGPVLLEATAQAAIDVWPWLSAKMLQTPHEHRMPIFDWSRGQRLLVGRARGALSSVDPEIVLDWIAEDPDTRAVLGALAAPDDLTGSVWREGISRTIIIKYGDSTRVRAALLSNLYDYRRPTGIAGITSSTVGDSVAADIVHLEQLAKDEANPECRRWLYEAAAELELGT